MTSILYTAKQHATIEWTDSTLLDGCWVTDTARRFTQRLTNGQIDQLRREVRFLHHDQYSNKEEFNGDTWSGYLSVTIGLSAPIRNVVQIVFHTHEWLPLYAGQDEYNTEWLLSS